ncbi:NADH-quinone oxidoreductase subunit NuoG [Wenzhouxiangella sp. XN24]|uniref:NADH-quinone oxidoreductase subunit NuoG n=1 Tax=Wenzhouxiangella sp. XN24 TaxID=2713569 RepID=UPI0013EC2127|nr:NADH-quinone oxidoreductase subunit NuoG [Wenzhouxiangella sp. XN24]NGX16410.1 NADH-quinone oxidoreductase subunit G [Wenzhouxiangella sp. XN24]
MDKDFVNIEVNGKALQAPRGKMIIEITDAEAVYVPRFCYHPKLSIAANCRMCLVEVEGAPKPLPACATPIMEGMKIHTRSGRAIAAQKATMEFLLINHPLDCPICDQGGECELQDIAMGFGSDVSRFTERKRIVKDKNLGPLVSTDMTRCIHCTRCVRFGQEIAGIQELGTVGRGESTEIGTFIERSVDHELSGNIIDVCPVGALNNKPYRYRARAWEMTQHDTVSPHDCTGAHLYTHTLRGRVMRNVPRNCEEINETWAADRDRYGCHGLYSPDRLEHPMVRGGDGEWQEASWEDALLRTAEGLRSARPELTGFLAAPGATLEEHYLLARLARGLGSPNLDHRLRRSDFSCQEEDPLAPGIGIRISDIDDLSGLLVIGSDLRREVPVLAHRVRQAALRGARVGFLNPDAFEWLFPVAGESIAPFAAQAEALAKVLAAACDGDFSGLPDPLADQLRDLAPGPAERALAQVLAGEGPRAVWLGLLAQRHPGFADLRVLAAALCARTGATLGYLGEGANAAGACLAGLLPHREIGGRPAPRVGLDTLGMLGGKLQALVTLGLEPEHDTAAGIGALAGLAATDFVVCLAPWATPAMRDYADVLLPVGAAYETSGTFVNCEGRRQSFPGAGRPVGEARPAWKVLRVLGNHLDLEGFEYQSSVDVLAELETRLAEPGPDPEVTLRAVALRHEGEIDAPGMYATDMLLRRSQPLQDTAEGRRGGRRWT